MSRRTLATVIAVPLMVGLWLGAALVPVPYVTSRPGITVDVLAENQGREIIQVTGHRTYYDGGELRMTTVASDRAEDKVSIFSALRAWISDDESVQPHDVVYRDNETNQDNQVRSHIDMTTSQDVAFAVALQELGYKLKTAVRVAMLTPDSPAEGKLKEGDRIVAVDGTRIDDVDTLLSAIKKAEVGKPLPIEIVRGTKKSTVEVTPAKDPDEDRAVIGIYPGTSYAFPFEVSIGIDPNIGGPSAGLMFSLAIYDTLTPGSLTGGANIAGTGTIDPDGKVGSIGGIQQKIAGARDAGAQLFLVPADNCADVAGAPNGDMRLAKVATFEDAKAAIEAFAQDKAAKLPTCSGK
ncbi:PDZ domain-containing protein [Nocardioides daejeonensis]|uniref:YlbL family protein n=1 Tax=Nocardioides daejeonensis TaxID=1046556 RepID=UPI000D749773|nr:PDZ domain-containing protein [Nocardioides daejeonensis]